MTRRADELTEPQKRCLRLVYDRYTAKEIGQRLQIAPSTVHYHLTEARRTLGVSSSIEAARLLVGAEADPDCDLVPVNEMLVAEVPPGAAPSLLSRLPWPVPTKRRPHNDLTSGEKVAAIIGLAVLFMMVSALYLIAIRFLSDLL